MATPTSTLPPQTPEEADEAHNPSRAEFLRDFENRPVTTKGIPEAEKTSGTSVASLRQAEKNPTNPDEFEYDPTKPRKRGTVQLNRKNGFKLGGGIAILLLILGGFGVLLPLKIPGLLQAITDEAGQRVEQITEQRAKKMVGRYMLSKALPNKFVFTGEGAIKDLMRSMRTARFEKKLEAKGITFDASGDGIKVRLNNELIGDGRSLKTDVEVVRALDDKPLSRKVINQIVKEEIPSWRWMKKAKFATWLRYKYNIPKYGIKNSDNPDPEERVEEMQRERLTTEYRGIADSIAGAAQCVLTVECDAEINDEARPEDMPESGDANVIGDSADDAVDETVDDVIEGGQAGDSVRTTLLKTIVDKLATKAIPIIGWIDLAATADHIVYEATEHDYFGKLASHYRAAQYARHYGLWSGYGSQIQLGAMDPEFISVLAEQTEGVEGSQAFNYIGGDATKGTPAIKIGYDSSDESGFAKTLKDLRRILDPASNIPGVSATQHFILNLYYETLGGGGLLGWVSGLIGDFLAELSSALTPDRFEEWFADLMAQIGGKLFEMLGLDFDPNIKGAEWFNATHGGATYTFNEFCQNELGCRKLSDEQASVQNRSIAVDRADYRAQQGLAYALFSQETSTSVASQLAIRTPTSFAEVAPALASVVASAPSKLLGIFTSQTFAEQGYVNIHGVEPYGALNSELDKPLDPSAVEGEDCDETFDGESLNLCQTDKMVAEAMICDFDPNAEGCSESDSTPLGSDPGSGLRIATFNILHVGESPFEQQWRTRMPTSIGVLKTNNITVAGLQEVRPPQHDLLTSKSYATDTYDIYPKTSNQPNFSPNPVIWHKDLYTLVRGKTLPIEYDSGSTIDHAVLVLLKDGAGNEFYVLNTHDPANARPGSSNQNALSRLHNARYYKQYLTDLAREGKPVFLTGDFNSRYTMHGNQKPYNNQAENLTYCVISSSGVLKNVWDIFQNKRFTCPRSSDPAGPIDHIYVAHAEGVNKVWIARDHQNGSDHPTVMAEVVMPWTEEVTDPTARGWVWPIQRGLKPGPCWNVSVGSLGKHAGMDINTDIENNPVVAMHAGTIIRASYDTYAGNYIKVKTTNGMYYIYQHLKSIDKRSGRVAAGEKLGIAGKTGRLFISSKAHFHVVVSRRDDFPSYNNLQGSVDPMSVLPRPAPGGYACTR